MSSIDTLARGLAAARERAIQSGRPVLFTGTTPIDSPGDLLDLFEAAEARGERRFIGVHPGEGIEIVGIGSTVAIEQCDTWNVADLAEQTSNTFATAMHSRFGKLPSTIGPVFVGGLAFEPRATPPHDQPGALWAGFGRAALVLPCITVIRRDGGAFLVCTAQVDAAADLGAIASGWQSRLEPESRTPREAEPRGTERPDAQARARGPVVAPTAYRDAVAKVLAAIGRGEAEKVVLARTEEVSLRAPAGVTRTLHRLIRTQRSSLSFAVGRGERTFVGSTPELLVRRRGANVEAWAVAATASLGESPEQAAKLAHELLGSHKERDEHAFVVREIRAALEPLCMQIDVPSSPGILQTATVQHLKTRIRGLLAEPASILDLVGALHPTPALAGTPRDRARELIAQHETFDRGLYGGPIGWLDERGDGEFFVALRCALIEGTRAVLFAGSGLVEESDPDNEVAETSLKLRTIRRALELV